MALIRYEGFDYESAATDLFAGILSALVFNGTNQTGSVGLSSSTQYSNGSSLTVTASNTTNGAANAFTVIPVVPSGNTVTVGAAVLLSSSNTNGSVIGLVNANLGQVYCSIVAGAITFFCGDPTLTSVQLGSSAINVIPSSGWAYVEFRATVATGTGGSVQVRVNGISVASVSGVNTSNDGTTGVSGIMLGTANTSNTFSGFTASFDDVYVIDSSGAAPLNTFLGPVRVVMQYPTANVATNFGALSGNPNWQNVDDTTMDGDSTYNYSTQSGAYDTFTSGTLASSSTVLALKVVAAGHIDDAGMRGAQTILQSGGVFAAGTTLNMTGSLRYFSDIYVNDPATNARWSTAAVNAAQFGYRIVPPTSAAEAISLLTLRLSINARALQVDGAQGSGQLGALAALGNARQVVVVNPASGRLGPIGTVASAKQTVLAQATARLVPSASGRVA
jgi:hypothetical protein